MARAGLLRGGLALGGLCRPSRGQVCKQRRPPPSALTMAGVWAPLAGPMNLGIRPPARPAGQQVSCHPHPGAPRPRPACWKGLHPRATPCAFPLPGFLSQGHPLCAFPVVGGWPLCLAGAWGSEHFPQQGPGGDRAAWLSWRRNWGGDWDSSTGPGVVAFMREERGDRAGPGTKVGCSQVPGEGPDTSPRGHSRAITGSLGCRG